MSKNVITPLLGSYRELNQLLVSCGATPEFVVLPATEVHPQPELVAPVPPKKPPAKPTKRLKDVDFDLKKVNAKSLSHWDYKGVKKLLDTVVPNKVAPYPIEIEGTKKNPVAILPYGKFPALDLVPLLDGRELIIRKFEDISFPEYLDSLSWEIVEGKGGNKFRPEQISGLLSLPFGLEKVYVILRGLGLVERHGRGNKPKATALGLSSGLIEQERWDGNELKENGRPLFEGGYIIWLTQMGVEYLYKVLYQDGLIIFVQPNGSWHRLKPGIAH